MSSDTSDTESDIITEFIKQYYTGTPFIPKEILSETPVNEEELLTSFLSEKKGQILTLL